MRYFSESEKGERPREVEEIDAVIWSAIRALLSARVDDGSFGATYPSTCPDGRGPIGTNADSFWMAMRGEIPTLGELPIWYSGVGHPSTLEILDIVQFAYRVIGKPIQRDYHPFFGHYHLDFDRAVGREEFRSDINRILRRNGLVYQLTGSGEVERLAPPILREELASAEFNTGDVDLDKLLETARHKFLSADPSTRREALEKLWDAWERLKTLQVGQGKPAQTESLLDRAAGVTSGKFRQALSLDAKELTSLGNSVGIRHSETTQEALRTSAHVDYLFHRLFALILLIVRSKE